jgi:hypothetical protein
MLNNYDVYVAFNQCKKIYGVTEVHVQLIAKQLGVLAGDVIDVIDANSSLYATRMNSANSNYTSNVSGSEYAGMIVTGITAIPYLSTKSIIREADNGGTIVLTPSTSTFANSTSTENWTVDVGLTGLTLVSVNAGTATKTLTFTGTAKPGTISIKCKAAGIKSGVASDTLYFDVPEINFDYTTLSAIEARVTDLETLLGEEGGERAADLLSRISGLEDDVEVVQDVIQEKVTFATATAADEILVLGAKPTYGDEVTIGTVTYTLVNALTEPAEANEVLVGASAETCIDNLVTAITVGASGLVVSAGTIAHPLVTAVKKDADEMIVTAKTNGKAGNDIPIDATFESELNLWTASATKLSGGIDGTVGAIGKIVFDDNNVYIATAECTISNSDGWKYVVLT